MDIETIRDEKSKLSTLGDLYDVSNSSAEQDNRERASSISCTCSTNFTMTQIPSDFDQSLLTRISSKKHPKRRHFWTQVIKKYNFTANENERNAILTLSRGVNWMNLSVIPVNFIQRHQSIYSLISHGEYAHSSIIRRDVTRTFCIFEYPLEMAQHHMTQSTYTHTTHCLKKYDTKENQEALYRVLNCIAHTENGYCQGMNFVVAMFLVEGLSEADAYALFLYLVRRRHLAKIYISKSSFLDDFFQHFDILLQEKLPKVHKHFSEQGFSIPVYGIEWFTTLFSLSTKLELACATLDMFLIGIKDIFLRMGIGILELLEDKLLCMNFEEFLREFKTLVRDLDPYLAVFKALGIGHTNESRSDVILYLSHKHSLLSTADADSNSPQIPRSFDHHHSLPTYIVDAIKAGALPEIHQWFDDRVVRDQGSDLRKVTADELLHYAVWFGQIPIAHFAVYHCGAEIDHGDDYRLTALHFSVLRNQPDMARLLLSYGADKNICGGNWSGSYDGLTPLETCAYWRYRKTQAVMLVLKKEVCLLCNIRFDGFTYTKRRCRACRLYFCRRAHQKIETACIDRHQCYKRCLSTRSLGDNWESEISKYDRDEEDTSSSRTASMSEASSLVLAHTPQSNPGLGHLDHIAPVCQNLRVSDPTKCGSRCTERTRMRRQLTAGEISISSVANKGHDAEGKSLLPAVFSLWCGCEGVGSDSLAFVRHSNSESNISIPVDNINSSKWYCNDPQCHMVFTFFSPASKCLSCKRKFCSNHYETKRRMCDECC